MRVIIAFAVIGVVGVSCAGRQCKAESSVAAAAFCVPAEGAPAGTALTLKVRETCGSECGSAPVAQRCVVSIDGSRLTLALAGESCSASSGTQCAALCRVSSFDCAVPALAAGAYEVEVAGLAAQTLNVIADGGVATCSTTLP